MKKIILAVFTALSVLSMSAQVSRNGNTFKAVSNHSVKDTVVTQYEYEDFKGEKYPIIVNKSTGSCYYWRVSKNGRLYRQYLKAEIAEEICKELGITRKAKKESK